MNSAYAIGRAAFASGVTIGGNPYPPGCVNWRHWNEGWKGEREHVVEQAKATESDTRIDGVIFAIQEFIGANIAYGDWTPARQLRVNETREHLRDKLAELIQGSRT